MASLPESVNIFRDDLPESPALAEIRDRVREFRPPEPYRRAYLSATSFRDNRPEPEDLADWLIAKAGVARLDGNEAGRFLARLLEREAGWVRGMEARTVEEYEDRCNIMREEFNR